MPNATQNDLDEDTFIGLELPLNFSGNNGFFNRTKTAIQQAKHNIKNLLLTRIGERLGNPLFGAGLYAVLFEQEGDDLESKVEEVVNSAMSRWLPFINIEKIETTFSTTHRNTIDVSIEFSMEVGNSSGYQKSKTVIQVTE